jgi:hypothetical protein
MYIYNVTKLRSAFADLLRDIIPHEAFTWLSERTSKVSDTNQFNTTFVTLPRKTGKVHISLPDLEIQSIQSLRRNLVLTDWTADRLARAWLLLHVDASDKEKYFTTIENLFEAAEVNELIALYSSLPLLAYPGMWTNRCAEGIRNNISDVLKVIMCNNPYPSENLNDAAWNQLVLKAFFTDKAINDIIGLDERNNMQLAQTLSDYAHERWAAHRSVNPLLWRCIGPFINEDLLVDVRKLLSSSNQAEKKAAVLAIYSSGYEPAKKYLSPEEKRDIEEGRLTWKFVEEKSKEYVLQQ